MEIMEPVQQPLLIWLPFQDSSCALMGPSGSGKSSLLNVLTGRALQYGAPVDVEMGWTNDGGEWIVSWPSDCRQVVGGILWKICKMYTIKSDFRLVKCHHCRIHKTFLISEPKSQATSNSHAFSEHCRFQGNLAPQNRFHPLSYFSLA